MSYVALAFLMLGLCLSERLYDPPVQDVNQNATVFTAITSFLIVGAIVVGTP